MMTKVSVGFYNFKTWFEVLEVCYFEWLQNGTWKYIWTTQVLEVCYFEWLQNFISDNIIDEESFRSVLFWMITKPQTVMSETPSGV